MKQPVFSWIRMVIAIVGLTAWAMNGGRAQTPPPPKPSPSPSVAPSSATPPKPGKRVEEILKLFETRDYAAISALVKSSFAPEFIALQGESDLIKYLADQVHRTGGIRRGKVREDGTNAIGFFQSTLTERWGAITLSVEPSPPNRISSLQIQRANAPKSANPAATTADDKARLEKISNFAEKLAKAELFSGVIAIARNDLPIFTKAYGMADRAAGVANTPETRFPVGEIDKSFTAVAIAQLIEAKKLSYDDPLSKFVEYPGRMSAGKITIKHLLSHTSGLGDYLSDKYTANLSRLKDIKSYLSILNYRPLGFEPGTGFQDSRVGYLMLGRVIEMSSGEDYYEYIQRHIFKPAGMENSFQDFLEKPNPKSAIRYEDYFEKDHFTTNAYGNVSTLPARGAPDNATFSTAEDLIRFVAALRNGKLVSQQTYQLMTTPKPELGAKTYGYGFMVSKFPEEGRDVIGHDGDGPGLCAEYDLIRDLKEPCTVVVLSNTSAMGHIIAETIVSLFREGPAKQ